MDSEENYSTAGLIHWNQFKIKWSAEEIGWKFPGTISKKLPVPPSICGVDLNRALTINNQF